MKNRIQEVPQSISVSTLNISTQALSILQALNVNNLEKLCQLTPKEIMRAPGSNETVMKEIESALEEEGLTLHSEI